MTSSRPKSVLSAIFAIAVMVLPAASQPATYDVVADYSTTENPTGPWSYGWKGALNSAFTPYAFHGIAPSSTATLDFWMKFDGAGASALYHNPGPETYIHSEGSAFPPNTLWLGPGYENSSDNFAVIRFTAPASGVYRLESAVQSVLTSPESGDYDFHVVHNTTELFGRFMPPRSSTGYSNILALAAGDTVDFAVGRGEDNREYGSAVFTMITFEVVTNDIVCRLKAHGKGSIAGSETNKNLHFQFKAEEKYGELKGYFRAFDEASGVCITSVKVAGIEQIDDHTVAIDYEVIFGKDQTGTIKVTVHDSGESSECDSITVALDDGTSISGTVGHDCGCDWGHIKVEVKCKERCKGGAECKGHPDCDEHPYCKGKICKGHKDCGDDEDDDGDDDADHPCKGHPECKPKCKGGKYCKGHPYCKEHPYCEVPNCKGHKNCKDAKCKGHPECRKHYKHEKGCKAKINPKKPCSCKKGKGKH